MAKFVQLTSEEAGIYYVNPELVVSVRGLASEADDKKKKCEIKLASGEAVIIKEGWAETLKALRGPSPAA